MSKQLLRKKLLVYRVKNYRPVSVKYYLQKKILNKLNSVKKKKKIGAYFPINYEIDYFDILKKLEKAGYKISLSVTTKKNQMDFFQWSFKDPLYISKIGIPEPGQIKKIYPDVLLVPLVAFDKHKNRLGYGGGYYDRYIQKMSKLKKILTIGIAFSFQEVNKLPTNCNDKKLDFILTEDHIK